MAETTLRRARKRHRCDSCALSSAIQPGEHYLEGVVFPGNDYLDVGHPTRFRECRDCAERYDRGRRFTTTEEVRP
ncbi:hypothetical protein IU421_13445 [Nocardia cyriacigeorgica]|uniref:hypothetical protein n=1 Tax=Nocardia cyriacigeorgica TaxID=135487 RepID=UPI001895ADAE|nr:hypothetical protein [Nocardia cyriacigeorgica]MBF6515286.1 hypothetical protein [Nocardia cyriacigeorgica]